MRTISVVRGGSWLQDRFARAPQQDRLQVLSQLGQVLVAQHLAFFVDDAMAVEEAKGRRQPAVVDELHDAVQIVQPVLQRRARQHQGERGLQALDHVAGLGFPVLDPLALVQNDQVPLDLLDGQDVAQHLLVVADGEEAVVVVLRGPVRGAADHQLAVAVAEPLDFVSPLRLERRRADDQHLTDVGLARQQLGNADPLDRLAQPHVVGQDRPPGSDGERDAVQLVRQQFGLQQLAT